MQKIKMEKAGTRVPNCQRGWKTFVVDPPGLSGRVCLHPYLAVFAYPTNDVVQTSHAVNRESLYGVISIMCLAKSLFFHNSFFMTGREHNVVFAW